VSIIKCKLFWQIRVEILFEWLPHGRNYCHGQTRQRKESFTCVSTNKFRKTTFHGQLIKKNVRRTTLSYMYCMVLKRSDKHVEVQNPCAETVCDSVTALTHKAIWSIHLFETITCRNMYYVCWTCNTILLSYRNMLFIDTQIKHFDIIHSIETYLWLDKTSSWYTCTSAFSLRERERERECVCFRSTFLSIV
jgi:hypothetical protein